MKFAMTVCGIACVIGAVTYGQTPGTSQQRFFRINVDVDEPPQVQAEATRCLRRELLNLRGVMLTADRPEYTIHAFVRRAPDGTYVMSMVMVGEYKGEAMDIMRSYLQLDIERQRALDVFFSEAVTLNSFGLQMGSDLQTICKEIVGAIDRGQLEPVRQRWANAPPRR